MARTVPIYPRRRFASLRHLCLIRADSKPQMRRSCPNMGTWRNRTQFVQRASKWRRRPSHAASPATGERRPRRAPPPAKRRLSERRRGKRRPRRAPPPARRRPRRARCGKRRPHTAPARDARRDRVRATRVRLLPRDVDGSHHVEDALMVHLRGAVAHEMWLERGACVLGHTASAPCDRRSRIGTALEGLGGAESRPPRQRHWSPRRRTGHADVTRGTPRRPSPVVVRRAQQCGRRGAERSAPAQHHAGRGRRR